MNANTHIDPLEHDKFEQHAQDWWDMNGPLKTLHDINPARLKYIKQHIALSGARILDLGCGGGVLSEALAGAGAHVTGLDMVQKSIDTARAHAKTSKLVIDYQCQAVEDFSGEPFDAIVCMEMLEHVPCPVSIIDACKGLLKPEGLLFLSTINRTLKAYLGAVVMAEYVLKLLPKQTHDYDKFIKPAELVRLLRMGKFSLVDMKGLHYNPLSREASIVEDVSVNYMMVAKRA